MKYFHILIAITLCSCSQPTKFLEEDFRIVKDIQLHPVENFPADSLGLPSKIYSLRNYIILVEEKLNLLLSSYNMSTGEFKRFQKQGRGPEELLNIQQITGTSKDDEFCAWASYGSKAFVYSLQNDFSNNHTTLPIANDYVTFCITPDYMIGSQAGKSKRFLIQDITNDSLYEFGEPIPIGKHSPEIASNFLLGPCLYNSELKKFAWFSTFGDILEIYNCDPHPRLSHQHVGILPVIDDASGHAALSPKTKLSVLSATATDHYILGLYSTHDIKDFSLGNDEMHWLNKILVYDWSGKPIKILILNQPVKDICFNKDKNMIYCIGMTETGNNIFYINVDTI